jgi:cysteine desulfurase
MKSIYFDNAATTPLDQAVITAMHEAECKYFANPSSIHSPGQQSKVALENARAQIADAIGAKAEEIVFTSGGTESDNMALIATALANRQNGRRIIISRVEHPAVLETCRFLEQIGFSVSYVDVTPEGGLDLEQFKSQITNDTILVSIMMANNETGCIFPLNKVAEFIRGKKIYFHTDAVQALGKMDIDVNSLGVDMLSFSAHKIYGPKGVGALYIRQGTNLKSIIFGGSQERRRRAGTENLIGILGFAEAIEQLYVQKSEQNRIRTLRDRFEKLLKETILGVLINGGSISRLISLSNVYFPFMSADSLLMNLDMNGIAVSTGSACSSGSTAPSHVLSAMKLPAERVQNSIRFSFGRFNTEEEPQYTMEKLKQIMNKSTEKHISHA